MLLLSDRFQTLDALAGSSEMGHYRKWPLRLSERGASFRPQVLSRVRALRSDYPGLGSSEGHPSENHPVIMHSGGRSVWRVWSFPTVGNSDSLGFSARRLEHITSWFEARHLPSSS